MQYLSWMTASQEVEEQTRSDNYLADKTLDMPLGVQSLESSVSYRPVTSEAFRQNPLGVTLVTVGRAPWVMRGDI